MSTFTLPPPPEPVAWMTAEGEFVLRHPVNRTTIRRRSFGEIVIIWAVWHEESRKLRDAMEASEGRPFIVPWVKQMAGLGGIGEMNVMARGQGQRVTFRRPSFTHGLDAAPYLSGPGSRREPRRLPDPLEAGAELDAPAHE